MALFWGEGWATSGLDSLAVDRTLASEKAGPHGGRAGGHTSGARDQLLRQLILCAYSVNVIGCAWLARPCLCLGVGLWPWGVCEATTVVPAPSPHRWALCHSFPRPLWAKPGDSPPGVGEGALGGGEPWQTPPQGAGVGPPAALPGPTQAAMPRNGVFKLFFFCWRICMWS